MLVLVRPCLHLDVSASDLSGSLSGSNILIFLFVFCFFAAYFQFLFSKVVS